MSLAASTLLNTVKGRSHGSWPIVPLWEVVTYRKEFIEIDDTETYKRCRVQLHAKGVVLRDEIEGVRIKTKKQQVCRTDELLVAEIDAKVGGFGIVPPELVGAIVSSHYFLFTVNKDRLAPRFLDYYVKTPFFRDQVNAQGSTNYAAIRSQHVLNYTIPLPPLPEQHRIVARIEELVAKIEEARGLRQQATAETGSLWMSGAQSLLDTLPRENRQPLRKLVTLRGGGTPSKANPTFWEGTVPWVCPRDMKSRVISDSIDHISEEATRASSAKLLDPDSVLIVVRGMILAHTVPSAVLRISGTINQDMKALIPNGSLLPEYLCSVLWALNYQLLMLVEKSTHDTRKLETPKLLDFEIPVPSIPAQHRIVAYLDDLQTKVDTLKCLQAETTAELDALLPSILDKAFKGEL